MNIETMTMTEKLLIIRYMIERGELFVIFPEGQTDAIFNELSASFNPDRTRIGILV